MLPEVAGKIRREVCAVIVLGYNLSGLISFDLEERNGL